MHTAKERRGAIGALQNRSNIHTSSRQVSHWMHENPCPLIILVSIDCNPNLLRTPQCSWHGASKGDDSYLHKHQAKHWRYFFCFPCSYWGWNIVKKTSTILANGGNKLPISCFLGRFLMTCNFLLNCSFLFWTSINGRHVSWLHTHTFIFKFWAFFDL